MTLLEFRRYWERVRDEEWGRQRVDWARYDETRRVLDMLDEHMPRVG